MRRDPHESLSAHYRRFSTFCFLLVCNGSGIANRAANCPILSFRDRYTNEPMERSPSPESDPDAPFNVSASLAPPRDIKAAGTTTTTFDGLLREPLLLKEDLKNGCGGQLWPAGMILSKYLLSQHSKDMAGKSVSVSPHQTGLAQAKRLIVPNMHALHLI